MRSLEKTPFIISSIIAISAVVVIIEYQQEREIVDVYSNRSISSLTTGCIESARRIFPSPTNRWKSFREKFNFNDSGEFSYESYDILKKDYLKESKDIELIDKSPESLMAYIEVLSKKSGVSNDLRISSINSKKRKELVSLIESIDIDSEDGLRDFSSKVYQSILGKKYQFKDIYNSDKGFKDIAYRIIQEDLSRHGLGIMQTKYKLFENNKSIYSKIINSKIITSLIRRSVYLPSLMGYLPPIKAFSIPDKFLNELISKGMNERLFEEIISDLNNQGTLNYANTIRYNVFRRYYNIGITLVWSYITLEAVIERDSALKEDKKLLTETVIDMAKKLDAVNETKIELLLSLKETEVINEEIPRECRRLNRCLRYAKKELGRDLTKDDTGYEGCKSRRDPQDICSD